MKTYTRREFHQEVEDGYDDELIMDERFIPLDAYNIFLESDEFAEGIKNCDCTDDIIEFLKQALQKEEK